MAIMGKNQNANFSKPFHGRIFISWNLILETFFCKKIKKFSMDNFFSLDACSRPMWGAVHTLLNTGLSVVFSIFSCRRRQKILPGFTKDIASIYKKLQFSALSSDVVKSV